MKTDQIKSAISARAGDHVGVLFDALLTGLSGESPESDQALDRFKRGIALVMGAEEMALNAVEDGAIVAAVPVEADDAYRERIMMAGARGSVNEARVKGARGKELDELGGYYDTPRKGTSG